MSPFATLTLAFFTGLLPALLWLWFWLKEDKHPEPKPIIIATFFLGMLAVPLVIPFEKLAASFIPNVTILIIVWSFLEELFKYLAAYVIALRMKHNDEPIDPLIYLITAALGFAALENTFFLFNPLVNEGFLPALITHNMRFVGATILHTVSSGIIGLFIGLSFYRNRITRKWYFYTGFILAVLLHALFNFLIIIGKGETLVGIFAGVWILAILLILMFEVVKKIKKPRY
jgi:protease PrsW